MSVVDIEQSLESKYEMNHTISFTTYIWKRRQEMLAYVYLRFTRFQQTIEVRQPQQALAIVAELQVLEIAMQQEVGRWRGVPKK